MTNDAHKKACLKSIEILTDLLKDLNSLVITQKIAGRDCSMTLQRMSEAQHAIEVNKEELAKMGVQYPAD